MAGHLAKIPPRKMTRTGRPAVPALIGAAGAEGCLEANRVLEWARMLTAR